MNLKIFFPLGLILIVFGPSLLGLYIDYKLVDLNVIATNFVWVVLLFIPNILFFNSRILFRIILSIFCLFGVLEIAHWVIMKAPLTITSLLVISNTNFNESLEFFDIKSTNGLFILLPYLFIYTVTFRSRVPEFKRNKPLILTLGILFLAALFIVVNDISHNRFFRKRTPLIVNVSYSLFSQLNLYKEVMQNPIPRNIEAEGLQNKDQTIIIVLGESANRNHMSLYGYYRKTNPLLEKRNDIIVYSNVVSAYSNTITAVQSLFTEKNIQNNIPLSNCIDVIDVFHSATYKTYWISNQSPIGIWDNIVTLFAKKTDSYTFVNTSSNSSYEATVNYSFDEKIFTPFINALSEDQKKQFIVVHLMGNHSSYKKRYPKEYSIFEGSNKKDQKIAEYDNSMLYNDFILDSIINTIKAFSLKNETKSYAMLYISDHGENVYDEGNHIGHDYSGILPKSNIEIPFILWFSEQFDKSNTSRNNIYRNISNTDIAYISDDLFHTIIDLATIKSPYFDSSCSVINKHFKEKRRFLEDGKNYDEK